MKGLEAVDWVQVGELLGVALVAVVSAVVGVSRALRGRLGEVLRPVVQEELRAALRPVVEAEIRAALKPALQVELAQLHAANEERLRDMVHRAWQDGAAALRAEATMALHAETDELRARISNLEATMAELAGWARQAPQSNGTKAA